MPTTTELELTTIDAVLPGDEPWQIINCEGQQYLPEIDPAQRQLLTWLTLPLAGELVETLQFAPIQAPRRAAGQEPANLEDLPDVILDDRLGSIRRDMQAGSNRMAWLHGAYTPEQPDEIYWLLPYGASAVRSVVARTTVKLAARGGHTPTIFIKAEPRKVLSNKLKTVEQRIPGSRVPAQSTDPTRRALSDPLGKTRARVARQINGSY